MGKSNDTCSAILLAVALLPFTGSFSVRPVRPLRQSQTHAPWWTTRAAVGTHTPRPTFLNANTWIKEQLLEGEGVLNLKNENPITTLTWFRGDAKSAAKILERRLAMMVDQNRWLGGRVVLERNKAYLTFDLAKQLNPRDFFSLLDPSHSPIHRRTPLDRLARKCKHLLVRNGPTEPLFKVALLPCRRSPKVRFALIVALSHVVGDGHTYYKLLSMLCSDEDATIVPLIYKRIASTAKQQAETLGQRNYDFFARPGPAFYLNYSSGMLSARTIGPANQCILAWVDGERMREKKIKSAKSSSVEFVSTNDVLTSWFLQETQADVGAMVVNFRNRLPGHTDRHAGNYESVVVYKRSDSAHPSLIRKSLDTYRRTETTHQPWPSFFQSLGLKTGVATNWSSFAQGKSIRGCQEELHIPVYDPISLVPTGTALMIVFQAGPKGLGLYMAGSPGDLGGLGYSRQFGKKQPSFLSVDSLLCS